MIFSGLSLFIFYMCYISAVSSLDCGVDYKYIVCLFESRSSSENFLSTNCCACAPGVLPYSSGGGVPLGSRKSYPLLDQILQILWPYTILKMLNCSWFQSFVSDPVKRDPILDQFSMITRPYTRLNGLKTIPFPVAHTCIANIWE